MNCPESDNQTNLVAVSAYYATIDYFHVTSQGLARDSNRWLATLLTIHNSKRFYSDWDISDLCLIVSVLMRVSLDLIKRSLYNAQSRCTPEWLYFT